MDCQIVYANHNFKTISIPTKISTISISTKCFEKEFLIKVMTSLQ